MRKRPAVAVNDCRLRSIVFGLLFTMNGATRTCDNGKLAQQRNPLPATLCHSASLRAFTPVFDGLWTRVNALEAGRRTARRACLISPRVSHGAGAGIGRGMRGE